MSAHPIQRRFPGRYASLAEIGEFVRGEARRAGFSEFNIYTIEMAVDEACSNIIEHAYQGEDKGEILLTVSADEKGLTVVMEDYGQPFDPRTVPPPDPNAPLEEQREHGWGLYIIQQWMDEVHFEFTPTGNRLTLVKYRHAPTREASKKP
ncbi:ATP-binding protein [Anaerolinea sp.]|uniref:ATP-binding protein n=1 Tax=Anaerolinea sp. TaxID=1872519 RepID=UPI002ACE5411|nr:ATP-binding protein [Anaerolinea sp.]